jgi:hypothetical protein
MNKLPKIVRQYMDHGVTLYTNDCDFERDGEVRGDCFLCGKRKHLYINIDEEDDRHGQWFCQRCGKGGGVLVFFDHLQKIFKEDLTGKIKYSISKKRGLKLSTLDKSDLGYNSITRCYTMPVRSLDDSGIHDIRRYDRKFKTTSGRSAGLLGWENLNQCDGFVYMCAGEWDFLTMSEILESLDKPEDICLSAPGENIFKSEWSLLFKHKRVVVLYDHDQAGKDGMIKIYNRLHDIAKSLQFIHWPDNYKKGFDLNDLYLKQKRSPIKTFKFIQKHLKEVPPSVHLEDIIFVKNKPTKDIFNGGGLTAEKVYKGYKKHLHLPDTAVIDVLFGTIIANRLDGDPLWTFIVAPSGFTKSVFLKSISESKGIHSEDTLSVAALVSGFTAGGVDFSLLPQLDGKVLNIKDFTTVLKMNQTSREEIFGMLRSIYDGTFSKRFGNTERRYTSRFGIIAGVTPAIEIYLTGESALGERFLRYPLKLPRSISAHMEYIEKAIDNIEKEVEIEDYLKDIANSCLDYNFTTRVSIPEIIKRKLMYLAIYVSILRSTLERDKYTKEILFRPFQEAGTRLAKQFTKLLIGICKFRRIQKATEDEFRIICKLALGTVPSREGDIVRKVYKKYSDSSIRLKDVSNMIHLPRSSCMTLISGLCAMRVMRKSKDTNVFKLTKSIMDIIEASEIFKPQRRAS